MNTITKCPKCGRILVERSGKYGRFLACPGYPACKHTQTIRYIAPAPVVCESVDFSKYELSCYQAAGKDAVINSHDNIVFRATAGSGKSFMLRLITSILPVQESTVVLSFNNAIARSNQAKMINAESKTLHSLGLANNKRAFPRCKQVDHADDKLKLISKNYLDLYPCDSDHYHTIQPIIFKIVHALKDVLMIPSIESLKWIQDNSTIIPTLNGDSNEILQAVIWIFNQSIKIYNLIDFSDMIYFTSAGIVPSMQYDNVLIDETQDLNPAQIAFINKIVKPSGRIIAVGDENQSIYGFRFADSEAMQKVINGFNARVLPLSITYRNPRIIVQYVNERFPAIVHECANNAAEGLLDINYKYQNMITESKNGDLILCRNNAPLIKPCYAMLANGKKAIIKGRDIGQGIVNLIDKIRSSYKSISISDLLRDIESYREKEGAKLLAANRTMQLESLNDQLDSILAISNNVESIDGIIEKISTIFSDDNGDGIVLSSIHKAKGLESDSVYWYMPDLIPSKHAKTDKEKTQENNLAFVACTRSKNALYLVKEG